MSSEDSTGDDAVDSTPAAGAPPLGAAPSGGESTEVADPVGPPWTLDVLADLHAGRYPAELTGRLRTEVASDPWATSVLTALDATVDQLSLVPTPRMPERFALRLDAAIADEYRAATRGPVSSPGAAVPGAIDSGVPPPRQAVDETVSATQLRRARGGDGQTAAQRRPSPMPPFAQPGPPPSYLAPYSDIEPDNGPAPTQPAPSLGPPPRRATPSTAAAVPRPAAPQAAAGAAPRLRPGVPSFAGPGSIGGPGAPVRSLDVARAKRRRWVGGLAAAAAVIVIGTATVVSLHHTDGPGLQAAAPGATAGASSGGPNALELDPGRLGDALKQIEGKRPVGPLQDAATYSRCLAANAIDPSAVTGVTSVTFEGKPAAAIAVVVDAGHRRIVVVGPACGVTGAADQLAAQTVSR